MFPRGALAKEAAPAEQRPAKDTLFSSQKDAERAAAAAAAAAPPAGSRKRARSEGKGKGKPARSGDAGAGAGAGAEEEGEGGGALLKRAVELSVPRLRPGMPLLGRVRRVTATQLTLSLPSGLTGYCRVEDTNDALAAACAGGGRGGGAEAEEAEEEAEAEEGRAEGGAAGGPPTLRTFFRAGQYVCAVVKSVGDAGGAGGLLAEAAASAAGKGSARRIWVTLRPEAVNAGLALEHLQGASSADAGAGAAGGKKKKAAAAAAAAAAAGAPGTLLWGHLHSVEDHGCVIALGIAGLAGAFLPRAAMDGSAGQAGIPLHTAHAGAPVLVTVASVNAGARTVTLACSAAGSAAATLAVSAAASATPHTIHTLKAGMRLQAEVSRALPNGLALRLLDFFQGTASLNHLPAPAHALWAGAPPPPSLPVRILFVDTLEKVVVCSAAPHIVDFGAAEVGSSSSGSSSSSKLEAGEEGGALCGTGGPSFAPLRDGSVIERAVVLRIDHGLGMLVGWGGGGGEEEEAEAEAGSALPLAARLARAGARWRHWLRAHFAPAGRRRQAGVH